MNSTLKHTIIAVATASLSLSAACKSNEGPEALEVSAGAEAKDAVLDAEAGYPIEAKRAAEKAQREYEEAEAEASCGEGTCGGN
jgi:hypothetical protein